MKKSVFTLFAIMMASGLFAQNNGAIKGSVIDKDTKESIPFANVWIELGGGLMGTTTDIEGKFMIKPIPPGEYILNISFIGYNNLKITTVRVLPDRIKYQDRVELSKVDKVLGIIDVVAKDPSKMFDKSDPKKTTMIQKEIRQRADSKDLKSMITNLGSGVTRSADGRELYFRGSRALAFNYYIDGIKVDATANINIPSRAISSLSVYAGGVPAKYGDVTGGVIIIETMTYFELYRQWKAHNL